MSVRSSRGRPLNAPAAFIHPCQPTVAKQPPLGPGWAHELKHDGYRLQIHVRDGRVRLYTINGADWSNAIRSLSMPRHISKAPQFLTPRLSGSGWTGLRTSTRCTVGSTIKMPAPCAFDLLMVNGDDLRRKPYAERKATLRKLLRYGRGIQYVEHAEGHGDKLFDAACNLGLEGIVSKKLDAPYRSGPSKTWIKVKNPKAPAATRALDGTF